MKLYRPYLSPNQFEVLKASAYHIEQISYDCIDYSGPLNLEIGDHFYTISAKSDSGINYIIENIQDYDQVQDLIVNQ